MDELVAIIQRLISERGIQILSDKRLYNIVLDLSSDFRSNFEFQKILKAIVDNGFMSSIIDTPHDNRFMAIAKTARQINSKYWLDIIDSTKIVGAISLGAGLITKEDCEKILFDKDSDNHIKNGETTQNKSGNDNIEYFGKGEINKKSFTSNVEISNMESIFVDLTEDNSFSDESTNNRKDKGLINPWEPFTKYKFPTTTLLKRYYSKSDVDMEDVRVNSSRIVEVLKSFEIQVTKIRATVGPVVTFHEITLADGERISKIHSLEKDIAISLPGRGVRILAPIPGKGTIGIEIPNKSPKIVSMESVLYTKQYRESRMELPLSIGITPSNEVFMADLAKLPNLLISGSTGQGKSVCLNSIIISLLFKKHPNELKFVLMDTRLVEFGLYKKIAPHFLATLPNNEKNPIISDAVDGIKVLSSLCELLESRYELLKKALVKNIVDYNNKFIHRHLNPSNGHAYMPYIVTIIDEYSDFMQVNGSEFEQLLTRLAKLGRAVGLHFIISTRQPTTDIITHNIKNFFTTRIAFRVPSQEESRNIINRSGAEQLLGVGDMLFTNGGEPVRVQCAFIDTPEIEAVNDYIASQPGPAEPLELLDINDNNIDLGTNVAETDVLYPDPLFDEAAHAIVKTQQGSTSMIQRRFSIGYNHAGKLMDQLKRCGIVGPAKDSQPREVLIDNEYELNFILTQIHNGIPLNKITRIKKTKGQNVTSGINHNSSANPPSEPYYQKDSSWKGCGGCLVSIIIIILLAWTFGIFDSKEKGQNKVASTQSIEYKDISFMDIRLDGDFVSVLKDMKANPNIDDVKVINIKEEEYNVALCTKSNTMFIDLDSIRESLPIDTVITASAKLDGSIVGIFASVFNNKVIKINILTPNSNMVFLKSLLTDKYGVATDSVNQASKGEGEFSYYWRFENGSVYLNYSEYSDDECMIVIKSSEIPKYNQLLEEQENVKKDSANNMASKII